MSNMQVRVYVSRPHLGTKEVEIVIWTRFAQPNSLDVQGMPFLSFIGLIVFEFKKLKQF